jgi:hypothetical protein
LSLQVDHSLQEPRFMLYSPWLSSELEPGNTAQNAFAREANVIDLKTQFTSIPLCFASKL